MTYLEELTRAYCEVRTRLRTVPAVIPPKRPPMRPFAPSWSQPQPQKPRYVKPSIIAYHGRPLETVLRDVAKRHGLTLNDMQCDGHSRPLAAARHEFCYLAAVHTTASYPAIGRAVNRDHTTVIHSIRTHCKRNGISPHPRGLTDEPVRRAQRGRKERPSA